MDWPVLLVQAEDGIRDGHVTGVQTCALPIYEWFSPIMAEVGPDGQVWIADWYNYIIQHNAESDRQEPTPGNAYANPLRDRQHGRIYRIVYEGGETEKPLNLKDEIGRASCRERGEE